MCRGRWGEAPQHQNHGRPRATRPALLPSLPPAPQLPALQAPLKTNIWASANPLIQGGGAVLVVSWWGKNVTSSRRIFRQSLPFLTAFLKEMSPNDD